MANVDLLKTAYWSDYQTNEQYFGLLSFDPGEKESVCYTDGEVDEWSESDLLQDRGDIKLYGKYDEKYLYFRIHVDQLDFENEIFYIPFDITPKSGSYYAQGEDVKFDRPADFLLIFDGKENSRILVQERYDAFRAIFSEDYGMENPFRYPPDKDSPVFEKIYLCLLYTSWPFGRRGELGAPKGGVRLRRARVFLALFEAHLKIDGRRDRVK